MQLSSPESVHQAWAAAFNAGDLEGVLNTLTPGAIFVTQPGEAVVGDEVRASTQAMLDLGLPIDMTTRHIYTSEEHNVALVIADWTMSGVSNGDQIDLSGSTSDVLVKVGDEWKCVIDNPNGSAKA